MARFSSSVFCETAGWACWMLSGLCVWPWATISVPSSGTSMLMRPVYEPVDGRSVACWPDDALLDRSAAPEGAGSAYAGITSESGNVGMSSAPASNTERAARPAWFIVSFVFLSTSTAPFLHSRSSRYSRRHYIVLGNGSATIFAPLRRAFIAIGRWKLLTLSAAPVARYRTRGASVALPRLRPLVSIAPKGYRALSVADARCLSARSATRSALPPPAEQAPRSER